jgi:extracellular factor (EF) 3-hydroxypalmitic acid methyl ester biosynthesis protein
MASELLDDIASRLQVGDITGMDQFVLGLKDLRGRFSESDWKRFVDTVVARHSVRMFLHEEPFTRHAYEKPRGYPGDAALLDLIYRDVPYRGPLSSLGANLHTWTDTQPACISVKERRQILANLIDRLALQRQKPRILSVACGHLREAQASDAVRRGAIEELVAVDQDPESLAVVAREQGHLRVTPVNASIRRLLAAPTAYGSFDFVYAAGLYDYLADPVAEALTSALLRALRPNGILLVANFAPDLRDIGYMEAIMGWHLIYRDEQAMNRVVADADSRLVRRQHTFRDLAGNVVYLMITRA